ncbi:hypothetical protein HU200_064180 [Digitaria exilis]|uniref:Germin-like protein n=1 Tax=Digitaria exilis TaxID=1010633 RepID=A0A835A4K2_9POAL|nr:hypothetical protein HU200_064180 [Digitaria exilis]
MCSVGEWVVCKNAKVVTANDFFFHIKPATRTRRAPVWRRWRDGAPGSEHAGHLAGAHRLHPRRSEPAAHAPTRVGDPDGDRGHTAGWVRHSNQLLNNTLFTKQLVVGDVFVFPQGLIHFQLNNGKVPAVAIAGLSSQNPGTITIANAVFGSKPPIQDDILAKAFMLEKATVDWVEEAFGAPPMAGGGGRMPGGGGGMPGGGGGYPGGNGSGGGYPGYP